MICWVIVHYKKIKYEDKRRGCLLFFLLKASAVSKVSNTALDDMTLLLESKILSLRRDLCGVLQHREVDLGDEIDTIYGKKSLIAPFSGLTNDYLRRKFLQGRTVLHSKLLATT